jgi:hypothetical protein
MLTEQLTGDEEQALKREKDIEAKLDHRCHCPAQRSD